MQITSASHLDHGLLPSHISLLMVLFGARTDAFFIETIEIPEDLDAVPCGLYGPVMGDAPVEDSEALMRTRGSRSYFSRAVNRGVRNVRTITVIAGEHNGECVLYTAFGGPQSPKEPGDPTLAPEKKAESVEFWSVHALTI